MKRILFGTQLAKLPFKFHRNIPFNYIWISQKLAFHKNFRIYNESNAVSQESSQKNKILVTGATGNVGREVLKYLKEQNQPIKAAVRNIKNEKEDVQFDFENPQTYEKALKDVDKIFLMNPLQLDVKKHIHPFIDAAIASGIKHITFLSLLGVEANPFSPHYKIEKYITSKSIPHTFLRSSFFMQNLITYHRHSIIEENEIVVPAGKGKTSFIDVRDIANVAVKTLIENEKHQNKEYNLTGGEALTFYQVAEIFTSILGRKIVYNNPSMYTYRRNMLDNEFSEAILNETMEQFLAVKFGLFEQITKDVEEVLGRQPITMKQFITDYASQFTKK